MLEAQWHCSLQINGTEEGAHMPCSSAGKGKSLGLALGFHKCALRHVCATQRRGKAGARSSIGLPKLPWVQGQVRCAGDGGMGRAGRSARVLSIIPILH